VRWLAVALLVLIALLQHPLWLGKGGLLRVREVDRQLQQQKETNKRLETRNAGLVAEVRDLKQGFDAIEERARFELGMVKQDEVFVQIADKPVPAGTYALFTIPDKDSWTVILNKNPNQGGTGQYKQDLDLLRFTVKPEPSGQRERLTFVFSDTTETSTRLDLEWEKLRVSFVIKANTDAQVDANIKGLEEGSWRPYNNAARYLLDTTSCRA